MAKRKRFIYVLNMVMSFWEYDNRLSILAANQKWKENITQIKWDSAVNIR